jgi:nitrate reductase gamma subunit
MSSLGWLIAGPFLYLAVMVFICGTIYKIIAFAKMPRPFRWDLYPLPQRGPAGSKYQKLNFNQHKASFSLARELLEMAEEIFLIKRLFKNNLRLWLGSYPFHAGLYLGVVWIILLIAAAVFQIDAVAFNSIIFIAGAATIIPGLIGSVYLLIRRCFDADLRAMSDAVSFLNLSLMICMFAAAFAAWLAVDNSFFHLRGQVAGLMTFKLTTPYHPLITIELFFFGLFLIYLPFSRMLHFAAKYFFYHNIMWDDEPMKSGGKLEKERLKELAYRLEWAAPHIKMNRSWLEQLNDEQTKTGGKSE